MCLQSQKVTLKRHMMSESSKDLSTSGLTEIDDLVLCKAEGLVVVVVVVVVKFEPIYKHAGTGLHLYTR